MKNRFTKAVMIAVSLMLSASFACAVDLKVNTPDAAETAKTTGGKTKASAAAAKRNAKDKAAAAKGAVTDTKEAVIDTKAAAKNAIADKKAAVAGAAYEKKAAIKAPVVDARASVTSAKDKVKGTAAAAKADAAGKLIDINTASLSELKAVPGIGSNYASKIIAARPYANKGQLKSRNVLPEPVYEQVKESIIAKQRTK